ncbi:MAG: phenylalanine--tRNA ligase subunit alpha [Elusimicrobia bacterium]|nr:phenylalanine--tRNA ligase subunit alpha [Candidatus Obscuribacterium magneticum]
MDLQAIERDFLQKLAEVKSLPDLESLHTRFLGRKEGQLNQILKNIGTLSAEERKSVGQAANQLKTFLEEKITEKRRFLEKKLISSELETARIDPTLPGYPFLRGGTHPITQAIDEICDIFHSIGFEAVQGPDIESDFNNFTALNMPEHHPARDLHDTFYLNLKEKWEGKQSTGKPILRTHTSPVQIRFMQRVKSPFRIVAPGRVYRYEAVDATHAAIFHQIEGLAVDSDITFADLKGSLKYFAQKYLGAHTVVRFRPSYFPFVEPGAEMDVQCFLCRGEKQLSDGKPCNLCKATGWIELLGAGMVHPNVFRAVGYDPTKVTGYAFGMGIERIVMTRYGIRDIRLFLDSDLRFLEQFR